MSTPPELLQLFVPRVGLEPTRREALVPKTSVATITPPRQLSPTFQRSFVFQHHKDITKMMIIQMGIINILNYL